MNAITLFTVLVSVRFLLTKAANNYNFKQLFSILIYFQMLFIPVMAKLNFQYHYSSIKGVVWCDFKFCFLLRMLQAVCA